MPEDKQLYVAVFLNHPLGENRYTKDFRHNLSDWTSPWWKPATEEAKVRHFDWALNHEQYHYSTTDINSADLWYCDESDKYDRDILEKYAPVRFLPVTIGISSV